MFVYQRLAALAQQEDLQVCSPVPWFPILKKYRESKNMHQWQDLSVHRPSFFYFPGFLKNSDAWFYARGLRPWLKQFCKIWKPDLLDAHFIWPDGVGIALLAKQLDIPYTITLRGKIYECLKVPAQMQQCADALKGAAAIISVSSLMADEALALGARSEQLHVITNGVNLEQFYPRNKQECRALLELPEKSRLIVSVAHLGHRKGHHEMIKALAQLPEDVSLVIVGGPAQGGTAEILMNMARASGVENRLILPGPQPYDKIPLYFSAADVSVLASYREGCPNAVLEALASGTPVVATGVGAVADILPATVGRIVPVQRVEPLADAVTDVLSKTWDAKTIIAESGVRSWAQVAKEVQSVFKKVLST